MIFKARKRKQKKIRQNGEEENKCNGRKGSVQKGNKTKTEKKLSRKNRNDFKGSKRRVTRKAYREGKMYITGNEKNKHKTKKNIYRENNIIRKEGNEEAKDLKKCIERKIYGGGKR